MIVNSKTYHKLKTMLEVLEIQFLISFFVTAYMRKYSIHVTSAQGAT